MYIEEKKTVKGELFENKSIPAGKKHTENKCMRDINIQYLSIVP